MAAAWDGGIPARGTRGLRESRLYCWFSREFAALIPGMGPRSSAAGPSVELLRLRGRDVPGPPVMIAGAGAPKSGSPA